MGDDHGWRPDPTALTYVYEQVADRIAERINSGELQPAARLPGEQDLAREYGVASHTIRRATQELRDRGLVVTLPSKGTFVAHPPAPEAPAEDDPER